jgi:Domain of unknown function (DUF4345)
VKLARLVLALSALPFAALGVGFLLLPHTMASLVGVAFSSDTADHDVRAVYGGLQLGCAALLLWGAARAERARFALVAQLWLYGGLAGARGLAWLVTGAPGALGIALHAGEVVGFAAGWLALRRLET